MAFNSAGTSDMSASRAAEASVLDPLVTVTVRIELPEVTSGATTYVVDGWRAVRREVVSGVDILRVRTSIA
jgi:hypothetical protein